MGRSRTTDWKAVRQRVVYVAEVLNLDDGEVHGAMNDEGLISFAHRHRQSLDWLVEGDPRVMIARCAAA